MSTFEVDNERLELSKQRKLIVTSVYVCNMAANSSAIMDGTEDVILNFGEEEETVDRRKKVKHPFAVFFHLVFRCASIIAYLFCGWFSSSFIASFVLIVIFLSMDFWAVKNVTGRLLVGLRWWNYVDEDGQSHWVFESRKGNSKNKITAVESQIFWLSLIICQIIWVILFFGTMFTLNFEWFMVVIVGIIMNGANVYGYIRCKLGSKKSITSVASNFLGQQFFQTLKMGIVPEKKSENLNEPKFSNSD